MTDISYIIPTYNSRELLERCLDSLMDQTGETDKVIVVDDGSTDGTSSFMKELASGRADLLYLSQENKGQGPARNFGLLHAETEYVWFIDADDQVTEGAVSRIKGILAEKRPDLLFFDYIVRKEGARDSHVSLNFLHLDKYEFMFTDHFPWNKICRRSLFREVRFPDEKIRFQDHATMPKLIKKAGKLEYIPEPYYIYDLGHGANISKNPKKYNDMYIACDYLVDFFHKEKEKEGYLPVILINAFLFNRLYSTRKIRFRDRYKEYRDIREYLDSAIPGWRKSRFVRYSFWKKYAHMHKFMKGKVAIARLYSFSPILALLLLHPYNSMKTVLKKRVLQRKS